MPTDSPIIEVGGLSRTFGDRVVLNDVSLEVDRGETMVILGGSGCGKSTLLRHIIGLNKPTSGEIWIKGQEITQMTDDEMTALRTKMGVLFQGAALFNSMTISENVALPLVEHTS